MCDTADTFNHSITEADLRGFKVGLSGAEYDAHHNRGYVRMNHPGVNTTTELTSWEGPLNHEDYLPYFCPSGWRRFAVKVPSNLPEGFWENSSNMYHGLKPENIQSIVRGGFGPSKCQHEKRAVYLTPSIRYAAHPRYARIQLYKGLYYQAILQVRVLNKALTKFKDAVLCGGVSYADSVASGGKEAPTGETMCVEDSRVIDDNHDNSLMEFLWFSDTPVTAQHGLVVTGVIVRCLRSNPVDGKENAWWKDFCSRDSLVKDYTMRC